MPYCMIPSNASDGKRNNGASAKREECSDDGQVKLFYETYGRGDTKVLMIMGFAAMHNVWWPQIKPLSGTDIPNSKRTSRKFKTNSVAAPPAAALSAAAPPDAALSAAARSAAPPSPSAEPPSPSAEPPSPSAEPPSPSAEPPSPSAEPPSPSAEPPSPSAAPPSPSAAPPYPSAAAPAAGSDDNTAAPPAVCMADRSRCNGSGDCTVYVTVEGVEERGDVQAVSDGGLEQAALRLEEGGKELREAEGGDGEKEEEEEEKKEEAEEEQEEDLVLTGRELCLFDNRGIGKSTCPTDKKAYTTNIMAMDVLHLADHLGWTKFHVVGHSMGGMIATKVAATAPHRVISLALISTSRGGFDILPRLDRRFFSVGTKLVTARTPESRARVDLVMHFSEEFLQQMVGSSSQKDLLHLEYVQYLSEPGALQASHATSGHFNAVWTHKLTRENVNSICHARIPTAVIHGVDDIVAHVSLGEKVARRLAPVARFIPLLGAHMLVRERIEEVNACVEELFEAAEACVPVEQWVQRRSDIYLPESAREQHGKARARKLVTQFSHGLCCAPLEGLAAAAAAVVAAAGAAVAASAGAVVAPVRPSGLQLNASDASDASAAATSPLLTLANGKSDSLLPEPTAAIFIMSAATFSFVRLDVKAGSLYRSLLPASSFTPNPAPVRTLVPAFSRSFKHVSSRRPIRRTGVVAMASPRGRGSGSNLEDAARQLVDDFVRSGMVVGVGSGFGSSLAVTHLISKIESGSLRDIIAVPTTAAAAAELAQAGVVMSTLEEHPKLDFAFTDADVVQEGTLFSIIGRRIPTKRGSVLKEKAVARAAETFAVIVPEKHFEEGLIDGEVPVEIEQEHWLDIAEEIDDLFLGDAEVWRRPTSGTAGPLGGEFPLVTEGGHFVLDVIFTTPIADMSELSDWEACAYMGSDCLSGPLGGEFPLVTEGGHLVLDTISTNL
ncbi:unnamed protein product, partial [Closterium sp. NIES-53]